MLKTKTGRVIELPSDEEEILINQGIKSDKDTYELTNSEFSQLKPSQVNMTVSVDYDVLTLLQAMGDNWQTRVNHVLREWLKQQATHS